MAPIRLQDSLLDVSALEGRKPRLRLVEVLAVNDWTFERDHFVDRLQASRFLLPLLFFCQFLLLFFFALHFFLAFLK